jgi:hypothetical protein
MENGQQQEEFLKVLALDIIEKEEQREEYPASLIVSEVEEEWLNGKSAKREREQKWMEALDMYYMRRVNIPDPPHAWRSRSIPPKLFYTAEQLISTIRRSLLQSKDFFAIQSLAKSPLLERIGIICKDLADFYLKSYNFLEEFEHALRWGCITGEIIMKIIWKFETKQIGLTSVIKGFPEWKAISPFDYIEDEWGRWCIERYWIDIPTAIEMQEMGIWMKFPIAPYSPTPTEKQIEESHEKAFIDLAKKEGLLEVLEFWGDLYLRNNKILRNQHIIIINRKYLALAETKRFFHDSLPYVHTFFYEPLLGNWGLGLYDILRDLFQSYVKMWRDLEDHIRLNLGAVIEVNEMALDLNVKEKIRKEGLVPFALLWKKNEQPAIEGKTYVQFNPNVLPVFNIYNFETENVAVPPPVQGTPVKQGRRTATEIKITTQQALSMLDLISLRIEKKVLNEIIRKLILLVIEYEDLQKIGAIVGEQNLAILFGLDPNTMTFTRTREDLANLITERLAVSVYGITEALHRQEKIEKLISLLEIGANVPDLNIRKIIEKLATLFGFIPEEFLNPLPTPEQVQQQQSALVQLAAVILESSQELDKTIMDMMDKFPPEIILAAIQLLQQQKQQQQG